ncbi:MAG: glycoside hydrolase family 88 protein, partial [Sphingobacteriaceae bacterium]
MAKTVMTLWKDTLATGSHFTAGEGLILKGMQAVWQQTGQGKYFNYIKQNADKFIAPGGDIRKDDKAEYAVDNVFGLNMLTLYNVLG